MSLKVDPGSESAATARFIRASAGASFAALGLNFGQFASARISPVFGFITITVPARACVLAMAAASSRSAMYWIFSSSVSTALALRFSAIEPALPRVGHHDDFFALSSNLAIQFVFNPAQALFIQIDEAQYMRSEIALRIDALIFLLEVHALQIQRLHRILLVWRQLPRDPYKGTRRLQASFKQFTWNSQDAGQQPRRQLLVAKLGGHRKRRIHRDAHRQRVHIAVEDRAALRCDFDHALLLPLRPGHIFAVKEKLQVSQTPKNGAHP